MIRNLDIERLKRSLTVRTDMTSVTSTITLLQVSATRFPIYINAELSRITALVYLYTKTTFFLVCFSTGPNRVCRSSFLFDPPQSPLNKEHYISPPLRNPQPLKKGNLI